MTIYHLVLESTLGLTSFKFITDYLNDNALLPGFVEGYSLIHHDETRHIGYGVWFLRESVAAQLDPSLIVLGTFLRGPNWNFFGPFEYWDIHKLEALLALAPRIARSELERLPLLDHLPQSQRDLGLPGGPGVISSIAAAVMAE